MILPGMTGSIVLPAVLASLTAGIYYIYSRFNESVGCDFNRFARKLATGEERGALEEYDVVIVGGGTSGCVLASRLSENEKIRVLLLEAGGSAINHTFSRIPLMFPMNFRSKYDYSLHTVPQEHAEMKAKFWPRGKSLGGCSSMNAMIFHHGAPSDYDMWAELQKGASGWNYQNFSQYLRKFEAYHPSSKHPSVNCSLRGQSGRMSTGHFAYVSAATKRFLEACNRVGIPYTPDFNTPSGTLGANTAMTFIDATGQRVSTESAYLSSDVLARANLTIATGAHVSKVVFNRIDGKVPRAVAVHFKDSYGNHFEATAKHQIILSAGAVHTPQILMLSGIGPASHLTSHSIPIIADLPGVGSHLMDHPVADYHFRDRTKSMFAGLSHDPRKHGKISLAATLQELALGIQYKLTGRGPLTSTIIESLAFVRSSDEALFRKAGITLPAPGNLEDTTTGPDAPDLELWFSPMTWLRHTCGSFAEGHHFSLHSVLLRPTSMGTIRLQSANPTDPPLIDPQYLATSHDVEVLIRGARLLGSILRQEPLAEMVDELNPEESAGLLNHDLATKSDSEIEALIRGRVETLYHPACTARMAPREDGGVVDPFLRVYDVEGLRVCDASVFPTIISGHTASPTIAVAEKAAEMILRDIVGEM